MKKLSQNTLYLKMLDLDFEDKKEFLYAHRIIREFGGNPRVRNVELSRYYKFEDLIKKHKVILERQVKESIAQEWITGKGFAGWRYYLVKNKVIYSPKVLQGQMFKTALEARTRQTEISGFKAAAISAAKRKGMTQHQYRLKRGGL